MMIVEVLYENMTIFLIICLFFGSCQCFAFEDTAVLIASRKSNSGSGFISICRLLEASFIGDSPAKVV